MDRFQLSRLRNTFHLHALIETGAGSGDSIARALAEGFLQASSCEIHAEIFRSACLRFQGDARVSLHQLSSRSFIESVVSKLPRTPALVFLDAHFPGADFGFGGYEDESDASLRLPLLDELTLLAQQRRDCGDVLIIDDTRIYRPGDFQHGECPAFARSWHEEAAFDQALGLFSGTHALFESRLDTGYAVLLPRATTGSAEPLASFLRPLPNDAAELWAATPVAGTPRNTAADDASAGHLPPRQRAEQLKLQGNDLLARNDLRGAETCYRQSLAADPDYMPSHYNLGNVLRLQRRDDEALAAYRRAEQLAPQDYDIKVNAGITYKQMGRLRDALSLFESAAALAPTAIEPMVNRAIVLGLLGQYDEALYEFDRSLYYRPGSDVIRYRRSLFLMLLGEWNEGLADHACRFAAGEVPAPPPYARNLPWWDGRKPLQQKCVLVWPEQGQGDTIQMLRLVRLLRQRGAAQVFVYAYPSLTRLLASSPEIDCVTDDGTTLPATPDYCVSDMSLLDLLGPALDQPPLALDIVPADHPVISQAPGLKVGFCWQGSRTHERDLERSIPAELFWRHFSQIAGVSCFSVQPDIPSPAGVIPLAPVIRDYLDTAQLVRQLDLVITIDTSLAHLCGTLNVPTWMMVTHSPDWRWGLGSDRTPYYPSLRLFRQETPGEWNPVLARVADELARRIGQRPMEVNP